YRSLANGGDAAPLMERADTPESTAKRLLDPVAAWHVGNALFGTPPPEHAPHGRIAFKTGTSYGYRDAWAIGFDGRMTIGVWVGRPDGAPVPGLYGRASAAPILFDAFARSGFTPVPLPQSPDGARLELAGGDQPNPVALKIAGGRAPLTVMVNGVPLAAESGRRTLFFRPDGPGFVRVTVMDATGATDSVSVRMQ